MRLSCKGTPEPVVIWDKSFRRTDLNDRSAFPQVAVFSQCYLRVAAAFLLLIAAAIPAHGREKDVLQYGEGLIVNVPLPEAEVVQVVEDVAKNTLIRGTKEYNKDEDVAGAGAATSTPGLSAGTRRGKGF